MYQLSRKDMNFNIKEIVLFISIFLMIYVSSSYNSTIMSGSLTLVIAGICGVLVIFVCKKDNISMRLLYSVLVLSSSVMITTLFTEDSIKDAAIMVFVILIAMMFVMSLDYIKYSKVYNNVMLLITISSLFSYVLSVFLPSIVRLFPGTYNRPGTEIYNLGLTFVNIAPDLIRNMGVFWEPGAFQTYLVFAILIEILIFTKPRKIALISFGLALLTTWSTTGFINGLILVLIYILYKNRSTQMKYFKSIIIILLISVTFVGIYSILPYNIQYSMFGKITTFLNSDQSTVTSASVRTSSTIEPLKAFITSPFYGVGNSGLEESVLIANHTMNTNTPVNWFAAYGLVVGILFCLGVYKFSRKLTNNLSPVILSLVIITILLSIATQQYLRNVPIIIFLLYGLSENGKNRIH